jgi:hypothetical protein
VVVVRGMEAVGGEGRRLKVKYYVREKASH